MKTYVCGRSGLPVRSTEEVRLWAKSRDPGAIDASTLSGAHAIVEAVRSEGDSALRRFGELFDGRSPGDPLILDRGMLDAALQKIDVRQRVVLERVRDRIAHFASAQRASITDIDVPVPGGYARQRVMPLGAAGCYAPGGRYPLPSSVLMTAVTARVAGVANVIVASPRPTDLTLAAASLAGVDAVLAAGGAQAIAAMAYGTESVARCDVVVGPGNRWVTAAKRLVAGQVRIDMLAGPSELLLIADASADPRRAAADLLAQAEHDDDAVPMLMVTDASMLLAIGGAMDELLATLSTRTTAERAMEGGFAVVVDDIDEAAALSDLIAPEHLQLSIDHAELLRDRFTRYGGLFAGEDAAEVLGDYGAGPNHTLPTGGSARYTGGLSVLDFLAVRTTLSILHPDAARGVAEDAAALADMEGLSAHCAAALLRMPAG